MIVFFFSSIFAFFSDSCVFSPNPAAVAEALPGVQLPVLASRRAGVGAGPQRRRRGASWGRRGRASPGLTGSRRRWRRRRGLEGSHGLQRRAGRMGRRGWAGVFRCAARRLQQTGPAVAARQFVLCRGRGRDGYHDGTKNLSASILGKQSMPKNFIGANATPNGVAEIHPSLWVCGLTPRVPTLTKERPLRQGRRTLGAESWAVRPQGPGFMNSTTFLAFASLSNTSKKKYGEHSNLCKLQLRKAVSCKLKKLLVSCVSCFINLNKWLKAKGFERTELRWPKFCSIDTGLRKHLRPGACHIAYLTFRNNAYLPWAVKSNLSWFQKTVFGVKL